MTRSKNYLRIFAVLNVSALIILFLRYGSSWTSFSYQNLFAENSNAQVHNLSSVSISNTSSRNFWIQSIIDHKNYTIIINTRTAKSFNVTIHVEKKSSEVYNNTDRLHVQRIFKSPVDCTTIVDDKNLTEIKKANMLTRAYREYRKEKKEKEIGSQEFMDDLMMIPDENFIFDQSRCDEFIAIRGYHNYTVTDEEKDFPFAFSMLTYEHAEQFERLLRVIYRPQNAYCIHVDAKSDETFQEAVKSIVQCFPNVFVVTKPEEVYWGDITRLQADINCIHDFMMAAPDAKLPFANKSTENMFKFWSHENMKNKTFRNDWKYLFTLASTEFPIRTNRELVQILKIYNGTNDIDYIKKIEEDRYTYRWDLNKTAGRRFRTDFFKSPPPYNYTVVKGMTYSTLSRAFSEYVMNSVEARALLKWLEDAYIPDEFYWGTLHYSTINKAPGSFNNDPPEEDAVYMTRFMGWPSVYLCDKAGYRRRELCILTNGDLNYVTNLPQFYMNKFLLNDDPVAYTCVEDWYARRHARENELTSKGEKQVIDMTPYCQYLHRLSGRIYHGCENFNTAFTLKSDKADKTSVVKDMFDLIHKKIAN